MHEETTCCPWKSPVAARSAQPQPRTALSCRAARDCLLRKLTYVVRAPYRRSDKPRARHEQFENALDICIPSYSRRSLVIRDRVPSHILDTGEDRSSAPEGTSDRHRLECLSCFVSQRQESA